MEMVLGDIFGFYSGPFIILFSLIRWMKRMNTHNEKDEVA